MSLKLSSFQLAFIVVSWMSFSVASADEIPDQVDDSPGVLPGEEILKPGSDLPDGPRARLHELFERFESEPDVGAVQTWAVALARAEPSRASQLLQDARARGALPLLRLRGRYEDQSGTKWDELNLIDSRDRDSEYTLDLWLEWDLAELASGPDALRAVREGRALAALRQGVINQVNIAFFDRRRLLAEEVLSEPDEALSTSVLRRLRIEELIATLDGLTGGRWSSAQAEALVPPPSPSSRDQVASEQSRDFQGEDPDSGLRVPVHPTDRPTGP